MSSQVFERGTTLSDAKSLNNFFLGLIGALFQEIDSRFSDANFLGRNFIILI